MCIAVAIVQYTSRACGTVQMSTVHLASFCIYPKWFVSALYIGNSMHTGNSIILGFVELFKCVCVNVFML